MKGFDRTYPMFSLCGLNCALCQMHLGGHCPGCGGGPGNQPCAIARCSRQHGEIEYCFQCKDFPCGRYGKAEEYDSFISCRNRTRDLEKAKEYGMDAYRAELDEKAGILHRLLDEYNDGRKKTLFCQAVNLLDLEDIKVVMDGIAAELAVSEEEPPIKDRAAVSARLIQEKAKERGIELKLRKKPSKR